MTNLDSILKSRDITLPTTVCLVKAMVFPVVTYGCESWTVKKVEHWKINAFELWCWRRLLRVPWTARRSNQFILKQISPGYSLEGLMLKLKLQYFGHLGSRAWAKHLQHTGLVAPRHVGSSGPGIEPVSLALAIGFFFFFFPFEKLVYLGNWILNHWITGEVLGVRACVCSVASVVSNSLRLPGSFVHGILQARILEWLAMLSSRGFFDPRIKHGSPALQADSVALTTRKALVIHFKFISVYKIPDSLPVPSP